MQPILKTNTSATTDDFIAFWCKQYRYKNEHLYSNNIQAKNWEKKNILELFEWKNGTPLSAKKEKSVQAIIADLPTIHELRRNWNRELFDQKFNIRTAVWKIFLMHIIQPVKFPIFDMHVFRAYNYLMKLEGKELKQYTEPEKYTLYESKYLLFYNEIEKNTSHTAKEIDKALWAFGKFISLYPDMLNYTH
jgi:hypothetical protein